MLDSWVNEIPEEEVQEALDKCVTEITRRKLETPAILFLDMHKALANVIGQGSIIFAPFFGPIVGYDFLNRYSSLFSKRDNIERLIVMLEEHREGAKKLKEDSCKV